MRLLHISFGGLLLETQRPPQSVYPVPQLPPHRVPLAAHPPLHGRAFWLQFRTHEVPEQASVPLAVLLGHEAQVPLQGRVPWLQVTTQLVPEQVSVPEPLTWGQDTHWPPQTRWPAVAHWLVEQRLLTQAKPLEQPRLSQQFPVTQVPLQSSRPPTQLLPHGWLSLMQLPLQIRKPSLHAVSSHRPLRHAAWPLAGLGQLMQRPPQGI